MGQTGTYILVLHMNRRAEVTIGRLGTFSFPIGYYLYAGSARGPGGLRARLARHLRKEKPVRWHIDYLLRDATVIEIWKASSPEKLECLWTQALLGMPGARIVVTGFGSSDCDCSSHLIHFPSLPSFHTFASQLRACGSQLPLHRRILSSRRHLA
jgi:Uri superfamily endonuclease